jgi:hypothetical protein
LTLSYCCRPAPTPTTLSPAPRWPPRSNMAIARIRARPPDVPLEFIQVRRIGARCRVRRAIAELPGAAGQASGSAIKGQRRAWFAEAGGFVDTTVYDRDRLAATRSPAPALIEARARPWLSAPPRRLW